MRIYLFLLLISFTAFGQRTGTIDADCLKIQDGICIDKLEFGMLENASANIQVQIDAKADDSDTTTALSGKVGTTGNESIAGVKTFTDQIVASSTAKGFRPCPVMTEIQRDAIATPVLGDCITNSNSLTLNVYNGTIWKAAGGGLSNWETSFGYAQNDIVIESNKIYQCAIAHTSGTFATDLAAVKWVRVSTDVAGATGVLPMVNGGLGKATTAADGSVLYTDADSAELLSGTTGQILQFNTGSAPTAVAKSISGKAGAASSVTVEEVQVPSNQLTATDTNKHLIETGNDNILANPSFEHGTYDTSWTVGGTATASENTSAAFISNGLKSLKFVASSQTFTLVQDSTLYASAWTGNPQGVLAFDVFTTHDADITVCPNDSTGTALTEGCTTIVAAQRTGLIQPIVLPIILGGTSNGFTITGASGTGDTYFDNFRFEQNSLVQQGTMDTDTESCGLTTSDFTDFGTVTAIEVFCKRIGDSLYVTGNFTSGTPPAATSAKVGLKFRGQTLTSAGASIIPSLKKVGGYWRGLANTSKGGATLVGPGVSYITFGANDTVSGVSVNPLTEVTGSSVSGASGRIISLDAIVSIANWRGQISTYSQSCGAECVDTFEAKLSSTGVVSDENVDWINGNCVQSTGLKTCTLNSLGLTVGMVCKYTANGVTHIPIIQTSNTTTVAVENANTGGASTSGAGHLSCSKTGADFVATRQITGTFKEVVTSPGIAKPKTCHYAFGGAAATLASPTECTSGTCVEVYDSCGTGTPPAFSATGTYINLTFANGTFSNSSPVKCDCSGFDVTSANNRNCMLVFQTGDQTWSSTASGGLVLNMLTANPSGTDSDTYVTLSCSGSAP